MLILGSRRFFAKHVSVTGYSAKKGFPHFWNTPPEPLSKRLHETHWSKCSDALVPLTLGCTGRKGEMSHRHEGVHRDTKRTLKVRPQVIPLRPFNNADITSTQGSLSGFLDPASTPTVLVKQPVGSWKIAG